MRVRREVFDVDGATEAIARFKIVALTPAPHCIGFEEASREAPRVMLSQCWQGLVSASTCVRTF